MAQVYNYQGAGTNYQFFDKQISGRPPRSLFDLSYRHATTFDFAYLYPVYLQEVVPGDSFDISCSVFLRSLPMVSPILNRLHLTVHFYYVPYRILWSHWDNFISTGRTGNEAPAFPQIRIEFPNAPVGSGELASYLGVPIGTSSLHASSGSTPHQFFSAMPFAAYQLIYRDYYLNHNLLSSTSGWFPNSYDVLDLADGPQSRFGSNSNTAALPVLHVLRYRDWQADYFTSALPSPIRGGSSNEPTLSLSVDLSQGTATSTSLFTGLDPLQSFGGTDAYYSTNDAATANYGIGHLFRSSTSDSAVRFMLSDGTSPSGAPSYIIPRAPGGNVTTTTTLSGIISAGLFSMSQLRALSINTLILERWARTRGEYGDFVRAFFGQTPSTWSANRPVYIGGLYQPVDVSEVVQTSASEVGSPLGDIAGSGRVSGSGNIGHFNSNDFGLIMALASVMPDVYYTQGLDKEWTRRYNADFFLPERAGLSMSAILNKEIYLQGTSDDDEPFGYQDIFDEMRYRKNVVTGYLADPSKSDFFSYTQSRYFTSLPTLSSSFVSASDVRTDAWVAPSEPKFIAQFAFSVRAVRPLPYRAQPLGL